MHAPPLHSRTRVRCSFPRSPPLALPLLCSPPPPSPSPPCSLGQLVPRAPSRWRGRCDRRALRIHGAAPHQETATSAPTPQPPHCSFLFSPVVPIVTRDGAGGSMAAAADSQAAPAVRSQAAPAVRSQAAPAVRSQAVVRAVRSQAAPVPHNLHMVAAGHTPSLAVASRSPRGRRQESRAPRSHRAPGESMELACTHQRRVEAAASGSQHRPLHASEVARCPQAQSRWGRRGPRAVTPPRRRVPQLSTRHLRRSQ